MFTYFVFIKLARSQPNIFGGLEQILGDKYFFVYSGHYVVCNTDNTVLFGFSFCSGKKTCVCLLFTATKTFNRAYIHFAKIMFVPIQGNNVWTSTLTHLLLIITKACMENFKNI